MRQRILFALLGLSVIVSVWLTANNRRRMAMPTAYPERRLKLHPSPAPADTAATPEAQLSRNIFEYGGGTPAPVRAAPRPPSVAARPSPTAEPPVKLVGIVRGAKGPRAALSIEGNVVVLAAGESADGYTVVGLDDEGVRVQTPAGSEITVTVPR